MLSKEAFLAVVDAARLVAMDLVHRYIKDYLDAFLLLNSELLTHAGRAQEA